MSTRISRVAWCAALACVVATARADVPPIGPELTWSIVIASPDDEHAWVLYPVDHSRGVPSYQYVEVQVGRELDPGRTTPRLWAFAADHEPLPRAPMDGASLDPFDAFFAALQVPKSAPLEEPDHATLSARRVGHVTDTIEPRVVGDHVELHLLRSAYRFYGREPETLEARADGRRSLPEPVAAAPPSSGCGCRVPGGA